MIGKFGNSQVRPYALGLTPQSSVYGATIPAIYGTTKAALYLIWAANLRQAGGSSKALKSKKGSPPTYAENVDFLLGYNPIAGVARFWNNNQKYDLTSAVQSTAITPGGAGTITIADAEFNFLLGVTLTLPYDVTFNDYGGQGSVHLVGNYEYPLWNSAYAGPDRINMSGWRWYPYIYRWVPYSGATIDLDINAKGGLPAGTIKLYYLKRVAAGADTPAGALRLTFENQLGNGPEFSGYSGQQIIYPHYAGLGSPNLDLGTMQMLPNIIPEVVGTFPLYPEGDADFADMIEDIFHGVAQAVQGSGPNYSTIQHGLSCYQFPGAIQKKLRTSAAAFGSVLYDLPVNGWALGETMGSSHLICIARNASGSALSVSDSKANSWGPVFGGSPAGYQVWIAASASGPGQDTITISPTSTNTDVQILEIDGVDELLSQAGSTGTNGPITGSVTIATDPGVPVYILAAVIAANGASSVQPSDPPAHWSRLMMGQGRTWSMYRIVTNPGTYSFSFHSGYVGGWRLAILAFYATVPPAWPKFFGDILDPVTMQQTRDQCRANGLWGSLVLDSQRPARDILADLAVCSNAAPVWSGFQLKWIPWSEVSNVGNGATYNAPTAAGPIADLQVADHIGDSKTPCITVTRRAQVDSANLFSIQHPNRGSDYNDVTTADPDQATIALYGSRKPQPKVLRAIQDVQIARMIGGVQVRRENYIRNTYAGTLQAKWKLLEPMDLVTLTEPLLGLDQFPVRITSISENENYDLAYEAEPFVYGVHAPAPVTIGTPDPYVPFTSAIPALVNSPVMFEPIAATAGFTTINELWLAISNADPLYGGADVYVSTDGGASYQFNGTVFGNAVTGKVTFGTWPASTDPDNSNSLFVDLTESLGVLESYTDPEKNGFIFPCYVEGGAGSIPYELTTYGTATLLAPYVYQLEASSILRRSVAGAPTPGVGVAHTVNKRFAPVNPSLPGIYRMQLQPNWINRELKIKVVGFNIYNGGFQDIANVTAYSFTPTGIGGSVTTKSNSVNYTQTPAIALSQSSAILTIADVIVQFPTQSVKYLGIDFGLSGPTLERIVYVFYDDKNYGGIYQAALAGLTSNGAGGNVIFVPAGNVSKFWVGQTFVVDSGTNFVAGNYVINSFVDDFHFTTLTSPTPSGAGSSGVGHLRPGVIVVDDPTPYLGVQGYVYIGSFYTSVAGTPPPGAGTATPGGWPPPQIFLVNGSGI